MKAALKSPQFFRFSGTAGVYVFSFRIKGTTCVFKENSRCVAKRDSAAGRIEILSVHTLKLARQKEKKTGPNKYFRNLSVLKGILT